MTREEAKELAHQAAQNNPPSYYTGPDFEPHDWVVDAVLAGNSCGYQRGMALLCGVEKRRLGEQS